MNIKIFILLIFSCTYLGVVFVPRKKTEIMLAGACGMILAKIFFFPHTTSFFIHLLESCVAAMTSVNWNVMGIFWGMLYLTGISL